MKRSLFVVPLVALTLSGCGSAESTSTTTKAKAAASPRANACSTFESGNPAREACLNSYDICSLNGGKDIQKQFGGDLSDPQSVALPYSQDQYGSSGVEAQVAARFGCRGGIESANP